MFRAPALVLLMLAVATAAQAENGAQWSGARGPARWLLERQEDLVMPPGEPAATAPANDPLSRLIEHCKHNPIGLRPLVTLMPRTADDDRRSAELPTLAFFARAQGRTLISLTRVNTRPDDGQEVVMQRTLVSDLFAGRQFSFTVYEDHTIGDATARLMGVGTRLTFRPPGLPFRFEVLGAYDMNAGASAYLSVTSVFAAPPLPPVLGR
jgi:hypothetical protein